LQSIERSATGAARSRSPRRPVHADACPGGAGDFSPPPGWYDRCLAGPFPGHLFGAHVLGGRHPLRDRRSRPVRGLHPDGSPLSLLRRGRWANVCLSRHGQPALLLVRLVEWLVEQLVGRELGCLRASRGGWTL